MNKKEIKKIITEYKEKIDIWNYEYYVLSKPSVSDFEYDQLMLELIKLENDNPEFKDSDSPSTKVAGYISTGFKKIKHNTPMLSLSNTFNKDNILKFIDDNKKVIDKKIDFVIEPKVDGLSISLIYENSKLSKAITRGDGEFGEDVTSNVYMIKNIPIYIDKKYKDLKIEIRGEIYLPKSEFLKINENLNDDKKFVNPRNAASGTLKNLNSLIVKERNLKCFLYNIPNISILNLDNHIDAINWLKENNFPVSDLIKLSSPNDVWNNILKIQNKKEDIDYDIDGIVIKLNQTKYYDEIGYTSKFPKWATAYKFPAESIKTELLDIIAQVGRTGKITYVANLKPVFLSGSNIMNASLHNANYIKSKDIRVGDIVNLIKAGDIIPYIISSDKNERKRELEKFSEIIFCPSCNSILVNDDIVVDQFCINENCHEKILTSIEYFASNNAMNIMNLSSKYIEKFMKLNIVNNYSDLYNLENHKDLIINAEISIKDKMFNKLINSINESKKNSLERLITGFGIKNIGGSVSKILAKKFKNINNLMNAELNELNDIFIIGEKSAKNIFDFFKNEKNIKIINQLIEYGINTNYLSNNSNLEIYLENSKNIENEIYFNKSFVITGTFEIDRNLIKKIIEEIYEGKILSTVTKKIDFLIVGENPGSKLKKAEELNIKVIEKIW